MDIDAINECTGKVISAAMRVHSLLGPGLLESAYEACLSHELRKRALTVETQVPIAIEYDGVRLGIGYRADLVVQDTVMVELKTVSKLLPVHSAQLVSYLRMSGHRVGLLINFNEVRLKDGIKRFANGL